MKNKKVTSYDSACEGYVSGGDDDVIYMAERKRSPVVRLCIVVLVVVVVAAGLFGGWKYSEHRAAEQECEDMVWRARCELELFKADKTISYLRLSDVGHDDGVLRLVYRSSLTSEDFHNIVATDSSACLFFMSTVMVNPERWEKAAGLLKEAGVDVEIKLTDGHADRTFTLTADSLAAMMEDENTMTSAMEMFVDRKKQEVIDYAKKHFRRDKYFKADSITVDDGFVVLHLSYRYFTELGVYGVRDKVPLAFRDPAGDMGSILDGMLTICSRTNRGFAFVYTGLKTKRRDRREWDVGKTQELVKENRGLWVDGRKTNRITNIAVKRKTR